MEKNIALEIINQKLGDKEIFSPKSLNQEILEKGGLLRIEIGVTIIEYLGELVSVGVLDYSETENLFIPTEICDSPDKWEKIRENPFTLARDQDF